MVLDQLSLLFRSSLFPFVPVTYATKQLTHALQELTRRSQQDKPQVQRPEPSIIPADGLQFSKEVENFLARRRDYSVQTRNVSVGSY